MHEILPTDLNNDEMRALRAAPAHGALVDVAETVLVGLRAMGLATDNEEPPELTVLGRGLKWIISMGRQVP